MLKKRYLILLLIIVVIGIMPQVTASHNLDNLTYDEQVDQNGDSLEISQDDSSISENPNGTFSQLERSIILNYALDLDRDYVFDEEDENYYKLGIDIPHEMTLNGNGHTIYGNSGRIFTIPKGVEEVKIYNLVFKNSYFPGIKTYRSYSVVDYGGAIYNEGGLYLENCTFIDCHVNDYGGAIYNVKGDNVSLYVNNCTFLNTSVFSKFGGAIVSYSNLTVNNSKFYECSALSGAAIYSYGNSTIRNSYFENNTASVCGGAIFNVISHVCEVYNSSFYANNADYGGAMYETIAINCTFGKNSANAIGGNNLYEGVIINCTCEYVNSRNFVNTTNATGFSWKAGKLIFENGGRGNSLDFIVIANPGNETVPAVALNIKITDMSNHTNSYDLISDEMGMVSIPLSGFSNGIYDVRVSFLNKVYGGREENYTLALGISNSTISFSPGVIFEYGGSCSIIVEVVGGTVERKNIHVLGYPDAVIDISGKEMTLSGLDVGNYTLQVKTTPDETHFATVGNLSITVKKVVAVIGASKLTVALKKGSLWSITLINSNTKKPIKNMVLTLKVYTGTKYKLVNVTTNSKGIATYKTSSLSKGTHKIVVTGKHPGYIFNTVTSSIKVIQPKQLIFKLQKRVNDNKGALISYIVKDKKTGKGINGVKLKLLIYTGKKVKTITLKSKKIKGKKKTYNGAFGYSTNELSVGKHLVKIVPASISYSGYAKTTMIIKKAAKKGQKYSHII